MLVNNVVVALYMCGYSEGQKLANCNSAPTRLIRVLLIPSPLLPSRDFSSQDLSLIRARLMYGDSLRFNLSYYFRFILLTYFQVCPIPTESALTIQLHDSNGHMIHASIILSSLPVMDERF
jgi:hypothetical protein